MISLMTAIWREYGIQTLNVHRVIAKVLVDMTEYMVSFPQRIHISTSSGSTTMMRLMLPLMPTAEYSVLIMAGGTAMVSQHSALTISSGPLLFPRELHGTSLMISPTGHTAMTQNLRERAAHPGSTTTRIARIMFQMMR